MITNWAGQKRVFWIKRVYRSKLKQNFAINFENAKLQTINIRALVVLMRASYRAHNI